MESWLNAAGGCSMGVCLSAAGIGRRREKINTRKTRMIIKNRVPLRKGIGFAAHQPAHPLEQRACSRTAALARLSRPDEEVCRPPGLTRLEWPGRGPTSPTGLPHPTEPS